MTAEPSLPRIGPVLDLTNPGRSRMSILKDMLDRGEITAAQYSVEERPTAEPSLPPVVPPLTMLVAALQEARNGLLWYRDAYPEAEDGSDFETMERIDAALLAASESAPPT